jgi:hypothetical protein
VADINEGDVLWIYPPQWTRSGHPDGFPLRIVDLLGRDSTEPDHIWVRGVALDRLTGLPAQEIVLRIPQDQPRADPGNPQQANPQQANPQQANPQHTQQQDGQQQAGPVAFRSAGQDADGGPGQVGGRDPAAETEPSSELQVGQRRYRRVY